MNPILDLFRVTVERFPDRVAISDGERSYTFCELWHGAACLASSIVPSGCAVGVFVNRTAESLLLFLSVVFSGNYYVPLDPALTEEKRKHIIGDAQISVLLGAEENRVLLDGFNGTFLTSADAAENEREVPQADSDTPLYMIYTSGSTGAPKGGAEESRRRAQLPFRLYITIPVHS